MGVNIIKFPILSSLSNIHFLIAISSSNKYFFISSHTHIDILLIIGTYLRSLFLIRFLNLLSSIHNIGDRAKTILSESIISSGFTYKKSFLI